MEIRESAQLRQLVNDYYHGLLTAESYRSRRASLLDNIGIDPGDQADVTATRPKREQAAESTARPIATPASSGSRVSKKLVAGVVIAAGIAAGGYLGASFFKGQGTGTATLSSGDPGESVGHGDALIESFLAREDWTRESLGNFLLAWEVLEESQRREVIEGRQYRRLTSELHKRIREEVALDTGSEQLSTLTDFAEAIGAPYRQSSVAEVEDLSIPDEGLADTVQPDEAESVATDSVPEARTEMAGPDPARDEVIESGPAEVLSGDESPATPGESSLTGDSDVVAVAEDPCPAELATTRLPYCQDVLADGGKGPVLVVLPTGTFEMGSDRFETESPKHEVSIAQQVAMSVYEVTVEDFARFCLATNSNCPQSQEANDQPVVSVSWDDASQYADWLTESTGFAYRLPTEAEWEYAARAGTQTPYFFGDEITPSSAHWSDNGLVEAPLASSERGVNRNPFRLYHMSGNVREWVQDSWFDDYAGAPADGRARVDATDDRKVVRGGSYRDAAINLRSAAREPAQRSHRDALTGFRVVREVGSNPLKSNVP